MAPTPPSPATRSGSDEIQIRATQETFLSTMLERLGLQRPEESTASTDDAGFALCDAWASIADILSFYQERIANEGYLRTARERRSIAEIGRLVDYQLRPGLAASVALAFTLEPKAEAVLPVGICVQSVPVGDQPARRFELAEALSAKAAWNRLSVRSTRAPTGGPDLVRLALADVAPPVRANDALVLIDAGAPKLRKVANVGTDFAKTRCHVDLAASKLAPPRTTIGAADDAAWDPMKEVAVRVDLIRRGLDLSTAHGSRDSSRLHQDLASVLAPDTDVAMRLRALSMRGPGNLLAALGAVREPTDAALEAHVMRLRTAPFGSGAAVPSGHAAPGDDWALDEDPRVVFVEAVSGDIVPGGWVAFEAPRGRPTPAPRRVLDASIVVRVAYGITSRCTRLELDGPWIDGTRTFADIRTLTVYASSLPLPLAEDDDPTPLGPDDEIELDTLIGGLPPGRTLIVEGELFDQAGAHVSEVVVLASSRHVLPAPDADGGSPRTILRLANKLTYAYRRETVTIWGNIGQATEGETISETLSADPADRGTFMLSRAPLTYVGVPTATGAASTLQIAVNGVTWHETDNLAAAGPSDRVFAIRQAGVARGGIRFGNGINGARLPDGYEMVQATYRVGLGVGGNCEAGEINQMLSRPAGVSAVVNPRPASGGADPETRDTARRNVPNGVTALSRLVGVQDYEDFARGFAGVGKARASLLPGSSGPTIVVTIAGATSIPIAPEADLLRNLKDALERLGDMPRAVVVLPARSLRIVIAGRVGLMPDYRWEEVAPRLKMALADRLGFARRDLGQTVRISEVISVIQAVEGVAEVHLDTLSKLGDPVTTEMLASLAARHVVDDVRARGNRIARVNGSPQPAGAEIAYVSSSIPELVSLVEIGT